MSYRDNFSRSRRVAPGGHLPYRLGYEDRVNRFFATLTTHPHLEWIAPNLQIAGAQLASGARSPLPKAQRRAAICARRPALDGSRAASVGSDAATACHFYHPRVAFRLSRTP